MKYLLDELTALECRLLDLGKFDESMFIKIETNLDSCRDTLSNMRNRVLQGKFKNEKEECYFFKTIKSKVVGYMVFYINIVRIENYRNTHKDRSSKRFLKDQIALLRNYFLEHPEFYEYHVRGLSYRDEEFFLRKNAAPIFHFDSIPSLMDTNFSTSHDLLLAKIIGNIRTIAFLENCISGTITKISTENISNTQILRWTGSKVDLVELTYALHSSGLVNNGQANLNELAQSLEKLFGLELGDIYRVFREIRDRKNIPTKLLDTLKKSLLNKIAEADG